MCGIVGKVNFDSGRAVDSREIVRMADSLRHRGPDDSGVWVGAGVGLGHRRLSIIDLSPGGRNPLCNEDATVWIVFNGEIYNFLELRSFLESRGHVFKSRTDTEVIVHLYEEYGEDCVKHLRGMFAFAIWDERSRQLLLARDRLGVKPLFYSADSRGISFGSEIKAIRAADDFASEPDWISIHQFLLWQCIPQPRTGFETIKKLPPASTLVWQEGRGVSIRSYWQLDYSEPLESSLSELVPQVRSMVEEATRIRLVADVPIGLFLSGGMDSACVLAAARRNVTGKIQTFSAAFGHKDFDESPYARILAQHFDTEHHEFEVAPDAVNLLHEMSDMFDEPFADSSAIPTYYLSKYTSEFVKVALSGDGGDEAFGGYQRYLALRGFGLLSKIPGSGLLPLIQPLLPHRSVGRSKQRYIRELLGIVSLPPREQYRSIFLGLMGAARWKTFYSKDFLQSLQDADDGTFLYGWDSTGATDDLARAMSSDTLSYIPEDLNVKVDICSMACGLEVRSPFLDHRLVEFCARIPSTLKIHGMKQKHILKEAFWDELPKEILTRSKAGFALPISEWFRSELREFARDILFSRESRLSQVFQMEKIETMLDEHASGKRNWHSQLWRILVLESWFQAQASRSLDNRSWVDTVASN